MGTRRTAITGIGVVAPGGNDRKAFWQNITAGQTATRKITLFDPTGFRSQIAAECQFDPAAAGLAPDEVARMDRSVQFAVVAANEAMKDSRLDLDRVDHDRMAVTMGSAVGSTMNLEQGYVRVSNSGKE